MKNLKQLLYGCFTNSCILSSCAHPFFQDGRLCATDGHLLIRIDEKLIPEENNLPMDLIKEERNVPYVERVIEPSELFIPLTKETLKKAVKKAKQIDEHLQCEDCSGDGKVEWEYQDLNGKYHTKYFECPVCDGTGNLEPTGKTIPDPTQLYQIINTFFYGEIISKLLKAIELMEVEQLFIRNLKENKLQLSTDETNQIEMVAMGVAGVTEWDKKIKHIIKIKCKNPTP